MSRLLKSNASRLESLDLAHCGLGSGAPSSASAALRQLLDALRGHPHLTRLDLAENGLGDEDVGSAGVAQLLVSSPRLE